MAATVTKHTVIDDPSEQSIPLPTSITELRVPKPYNKSDPTAIFEVSDAWRKTFVINGKRRREVLADTTVRNVGNQARWASCLATIPGTSFLLVGCGSKSQNLFLAENTALNKLAAPRGYEIPTDSLTVIDSIGLNINKDIELLIRSSFSLPHPVYRIATSQKQLIAAGPNGVANLYSIEKSEFSQKGKGINHVQELRIGESDRSKVCLAPPGEMNNSLRLTSIALEPAVESNNGAYSCKVAATQQKNLIYYDIETSQNLYTRKIDSGVLNAVTFSPHKPYGALMAVGGYGKTLSVLDTRLMGQSSGNNGVVWSIQKAHGISITDIKFNTFVPYWLATSGEGGVIKVWDIRYPCGPAARIDGHYGSVNSIAWCNTHSDIIASASSDGSWRSWSLQPNQLTARYPSVNYFVGCPGSEFLNAHDSQDVDTTIVGAKIVAEYVPTHQVPFIGVAPACHHADTFYSLTATGELCSHTVRSELLEQLATHHYEEITPRMIEASVFSRDLNTAYDSLIKFTRNERQPGEMIAKHEEDLIELCRFKPEIDEESWEVGQEQDADDQSLVIVFRDDLETFGYGFPPGYENVQQFTKIDPRKQTQFDLVVLRFEVLRQLRAGVWQAIIQKEKELIQGMEFDPEFMDTETIQLLVETILVREWQKGLTMGLKFSEIYADYPSGKFVNLSRMMGILLFPTVYDAEEWYPDPLTRISSLTKEFFQEKIKSQLSASKAAKGDGHDGPGYRMGMMPGGRQSISLSPKRLSVVSPFRFATPSGSMKRRSSKMSGSATSPSRSGTDSGSSQPLNKKREKIEALSNDAKNILPMVFLENRLRKIVDSNSKQESKDDEIIRAMQNVLTDSGVSAARARGDGTQKLGGPTVTPYEKTVSGASNLLYVEALLNKKEYTDFFGVCLDLAVTHRQYYFAKHVIRFMDRNGMVQFKSVIDNLFHTANSLIQSVFSQQSQGHSNSNLTNQLIQAGKSLRDAIVLIVRVSAHFIQCLDLLRADREIHEILQKSLTSLTTLMLQMSSSLIKSFEMMDRMGGKFNPGVKEWAQTVHDAIRDAARLLPLSNKSRPMQAAEKAALGYTIHEEAFSLLDRFYKGYIKTDA